MGHVMIAAIDHQALNSPDLPVSRVDVLAAANLHLPQRDSVVVEGRRDSSPVVAKQAAAADAVVRPGDHVLRVVIAVTVGDPTATNCVSSAQSSRWNSAIVQSSLTSAGAASTRRSGTSRPGPCRCGGSTTRSVTDRATGSTTTRVTLPQTPSLQLTSAPIVTSVASAMTRLPPLPTVARTVASAVAPTPNRRCSLSSTAAHPSCRTLPRTFIPPTVETSPVGRRHVSPQIHNVTKIILRS